MPSLLVVSRTHRRSPLGGRSRAFALVVLAAALSTLLLCLSRENANARNNSSATQFTIVGDKVVGGVRMGATLDNATAVFGMPEVQRRLSNYECRAGWRAIGLSLLFLDLS